jgi:antitoxin (DNA-binding transcriptional repressor) of toxin-antitoxin stability system
MSTERVSATEAAKNFGRIVDRVRETRATYVVERGGTPAARIAPVERGPFTMSDFKDLVSRLPRADAAYLDSVARASAAHNKPRVRRNPWGR